MSLKPPPIDLAPIAFLKNRLLTHGTFWLVVFAVIGIGALGDLSIGSPWRYQLLELACFMVFSYIILFFIRRLLYNSRFALFLTIATILIFVFAAIDFNLMKKISYVAGELDNLNSLISVPVYVLFFLMVTAIKLGKDLLIVQHEAELATRDKIQQELSFLRAQLSPHFLLNTMNNLYGLSVIKSDDLPPLMLRLSDLLRYTIYDTKTDKVPLKNEIDYLLDYIELQKIRMSAKVKLSVDFPSDIAADWHVAPLLLIVFVENAFKHSQNMVTSGERFIHFSIRLQDESFTFMSENTFETEPVFDKNMKNSQIQPLDTEGGIILKNEGIGLETTLRRIELIYGKAHLPRITKGNGVYRVELTLRNAK
jgi:two-component system, LytTR family, sensor histidine kinase LytS